MHVWSGLWYASTLHTVVMVMVVVRSVRGVLSVPEAEAVAVLVVWFLRPVH